MKRISWLVLLSVIFCQTPSFTHESAPFSATKEPQLVVNNRILIKVHGKTISVIDVAKKMDVFLSENYPEVAASPSDRFQFYSAQWKHFLSELIDAELMIADADKLGIKVTDAEVREQIHERFGPNVIKNLNKLNMNFEEAKKMIWSDMIVQRMSWYRVSSKALNRVYPQDIKYAYKDFCAKHPPADNWKYEVLSIRDKDKNVSSEKAIAASDIIRQTQAGLKAAAEIIKNKAEGADDTSITASEVITVSDKEISEPHKKVLVQLTPGSYSDPIPQVNRFSNEVVYRIFHLLEREKKESPPFNNMADKLKDELLQKEAAKIRQEYLRKIRKRFGYDESYLNNSIPADFQPFSLIQ